VLVSVGKEAEKLKFLEAAEVLRRLGIPLFATGGTADFLNRHGFQVKALPWPGEGPADCLHAIRDGLVDFVINIPKSSQRGELTQGGRIRQAAVQFGASLLTNMEQVIAYTEALDRCRNFVKDHKVAPLPPFRQ